MQQIVLLAPWNSYADAADHYCYVRCLDAFVCEANNADTDPAGFTIQQDGSIDRAASPSWWIDYTLLASLMAEHFDGRMMTIQAADDLARSIVEGNPLAPSPSASGARLAANWSPFP